MSAVVGSQHSLVFTFAASSSASGTVSVVVPKAAWNAVECSPDEQLLVSWFYRRVAGIVQRGGLSFGLRGGAVDDYRELQDQPLGRSSP